ncbi:pentapeptide repeat-containing protein [Pseudanabaena galeata]
MIEVNLVDAYLENASLINTNLTKAKLCNTALQYGSVNDQNCR